jgi:hypothetical protein
VKLQDSPWSDRHVKLSWVIQYVPSARDTPSGPQAQPNEAYGSQVKPTILFPV